MQDNALELLNQKFASLTKSEKKIANYIYANMSSIEYLSITTLAEQCGVADATIFRFCKSLGFGGYNEFKLSIVKSLLKIDSASATEVSLVGQVSSTDSFVDMCQKLYNSQVSALSQTLELLDEEAFVSAAQLLSSAHHVYCMGQGSSLVMAMEAWSRFLSVSPNFFCIQDAHLQATAVSLLGKDDVVLFFSYSGATRDMVDILRPAGEHGTKVVLVTHFEKSPAAALSDVILLCGSNEGPLQVGSISAKVAQLLVIDVLFNVFWRINNETCENNVGLTADATARKLL